MMIKPGPLSQSSEITPSVETNSSVRISKLPVYQEPQGVRSFWPEQAWDPAHKRSRRNKDAQISHDTTPGPVRAGASEPVGGIPASSYAARQAFNPISTRAQGVRALLEILLLGAGFRSLRSFHLKA
jgi:hypothetical protein